MSIITDKILDQLVSRTRALPQTELVIFTECSPYVHARYEDTKERMVFPHVKKVVFYRNEKYFADKWVYRHIFPDATEFWVSAAPGGFFQFRRNIPHEQFVIPEIQVYRGYDEKKATVMKNDDFNKACADLLPEDFFGKWGGVNEKYTEYV
jgi:hypothetical protein